MSVYVFGEPGALIVKIGVSRNPEERAQALRRFIGRGELLYVHWRATGLLERRVHKLLHPRFWLEGEWFLCGAETAISIIRKQSKNDYRERNRRWTLIRARSRAKRAAEAEVA